MGFSKNKNGGVLVGLRTPYLVTDLDHGILSLYYKYLALPFNRIDLPQSNMQGQDRSIHA